MDFQRRKPTYRGPSSIIAILRQEKSAGWTLLYVRRDDHGTHRLAPACLAQQQLMAQREVDVADGALVGNLPTLPTFFLAETATLSSELTGVLREAKAHGFYAGGLHPA